MCVGLGAVATTFIAGVLAVRKGIASPIGSVTQMGTIRLGKRTEGRSPLVKDFVPLAEPGRYRVRRLGHLRGQLLRVGQARGRAREGPAREDPARARGHQAVEGRVRPAVREAARRPEREEGQEQARPRRAAPRGHPPLQAGAQPQPARDDLVRQHRDLPHRVARAPVDRGVRKGPRGQRPVDPVVDDLHLRRADGRRALRERGAEPVGGRARDDGPGEAEPGADLRQGLQDRADAHQDRHRARPEGPAARREGLVLDQHPRQPRRRGARRSGVVQDEGREQEVGARLHPAARPLPRALQRHLPRRPHQLLPAARRQQGRLGQHRPGRLARLPDAAEDQLPVPRQHPGGARSCSTW